MVALTAKIDPEIKQAGGRTHDHTERASNEKDHGYHETLHTQGSGSRRPQNSTIARPCKR